MSQATDDMHACSAGAPRFGANGEGLVDYTRSLDCIHCGLCLRTCPTYQLSGRESASPRGRIHMMRAIAEERLTPTPEVREELDFCLVCRHCESVCPAGVEFGAHPRRDVAVATVLAHQPNRPISSLR